MLLIVLATLLAISSTTPITEETKLLFQEFIHTYDKHYATQENYDEKLQIFANNVEIAKSLNDEDSHAEYGVTKFMDLSQEEFRRLYLISNFSSPKTRKENYPVLNWTPSGNVSLPADFDWRSRNVVTAVYDQGQCGSCWAFSTTENIESMWAIAGYGLENLSMQQLVDCDNVWSHGCAGGNPPNAYAYVIDVGGIDTYSAYPYVGQDEICRFNPLTVGAKVAQWGYLSTNDNEEKMLEWTASRGPPSICVDAHIWQYYKGGVVTEGCGHSLDHCVQITGWRTFSGIGTAWTVRNSWGTAWGDGGYIYILYGHNVCGIGQEATSSVC